MMIGIVKQINNNNGIVTDFLGFSYPFDKKNVVDPIKKGDRVVFSLTQGEATCLELPTGSFTRFCNEIRELHESKTTVLEVEDYE